jgi:agmatine/peptidylarginine deiminase
MKGVVISWKTYSGVDLYATLASICDHIQETATVYILCSDSNTVKNYLTGKNVPLYNIKYVVTPTNSIWARDYSANTVYENEVFNNSLVDWQYNRTQRPQDDASPVALATYLNQTIYQTTVAPNKLVNTGGNYMSDGHGTAFCSKLVLNENASGGGFNNNLSEADVDSIMKKYMGIKRYIKMQTLPYDGIHHIDMHMKLLDEETLLVGQYPAGVSDGPQIETNLQYVLNNFQTCFNRPYKVIRILQPPTSNGSYPGSAWGNGDYRTYTNALICNDYVLVPKYQQKYDTTAMRIWTQSMPGYKIKFIDCNDIIQFSGALHCITHEIGVDDPIFISHAKLYDTYNTSTPYEVNAYVNTQSGVSSVNLYWSVDTLNGYAVLPMSATGSGNYQAFIPAQAAGAKVFYYIEASSNSGRTVRKPFVAPAGVIMFRVLSDPTSVTYNATLPQLFTPYPVPATDELNISYYMPYDAEATFNVYDVLGNVVYTFTKSNAAGTHQYALDISNLSTGQYLLQFTSGAQTYIRKFIKSH